MSFSIILCETKNNRTPSVNKEIKDGIFKQNKSRLKNYDNNISTSMTLIILQGYI